MTSRQRHRRIPSGGSATTTQTTASNASTTVQAPNSTRTGSSQPTSTLPSVRRTLFNSATNSRTQQLASNSVSITSSDYGSVIQMDTNTGLSGNSNPFGGSNISKPVPKSGTSLSPSPDNGDIVPRDKNGCYKLDIPVLPPAVFEEADGGDSMEGIEHSGGAEIPVEEGGELAGRDKESMFLLSSFIALGVSSRYKNLFLTKETEIDASFVEMMRHNRSRHINGEPSGMNYRLLPLVFLEIKLVLLEQLLMITLEVFLLVQQNLRDSVLKLEEDNWMFEAEEEVKL